MSQKNKHTSETIAYSTITGVKARIVKYIDRVCYSIQVIIGNGMEYIRMKIGTTRENLERIKPSYPIIRLLYKDAKAEFAEYFDDSVWVEWVNEDEDFEELAQVIEDLCFEYFDAHHSFCKERGTAYRSIDMLIVFEPDSIAIYKEPGIHYRATRKEGNGVRYESFNTINGKPKLAILTPVKFIHELIQLALAEQ